MIGQNTKTGRYQGIKGNAKIEICLKLIHGGDIYSGIVRIVSAYVMIMTKPAIDILI